MLYKTPTLLVISITNQYRHSFYHIDTRICVKVWVFFLPNNYIFFSFTGGGILNKDILTNQRCFLIQLFFSYGGMIYLLGLVSNCVQSGPVNPSTHWQLHSPLTCFTNPSFWQTGGFVQSSEMLMFLLLFIGRCN